jgi:hypothetical protein
MRSMISMGREWLHRLDFRRSRHAIVFPLQPVKRPFDRHVEKVLPSRLISRGRDVSMVHDRMHIAKVSLKTVLLANPGRTDGCLHEIDSLCRGAHGMGCGKLQLHFTGHVDQVTFDRPVPYFAQGLVEICPPSAERGFRLADRRLNGDAIPERGRKIGRSLSPGELQQVVNRSTRDAEGGVASTVIAAQAVNLYNGPLYALAGFS